MDLLRQILKRLRRGAIPIYIPDRAWGHGDVNQYEQASLAFRNELENQYGATFSEDNIGPGADWPAYVTLVSIPGTGALLLYLLFKGRELNESLDGWKQVYEKLKPFLCHKPVVNRDAAATLAINHISSQLNLDPTFVRLLGYDVIHIGESIENYDFKGLREIREPPQALYLGVLTHLFHMQVNGNNYGISVYRDEIQVREIK